MEFIVWVVLFLVAVASLYWYLTLPYTYWKRVGIPYAPGVPFFGSLYSMVQRIPSFVSDCERYKKYGAVYGHYDGTRPVLDVADPEILKNILVKDFQFFVNRRDITVGDPIVDNIVSILRNEKWKRVRTLITPSFTTGKIKKMSLIVQDATKVLCQNFEKCAKFDEPVDMKRYFGAFSMDVIASTAFGTKVDSQNDPDHEFISAVKKFVSRKFPLRFLLFMLFPKVFKLLGIQVASPQGTAFFKEVTLRIIEERKRTGQTRNDFLQLMMEAAGITEESKSKTESQEDENELDPKVAMTPKGMSQDELVAQCVIFFIAGYDTTASTLSFATYLLALNPDCQERLIQEIDETLAEHKGIATYEAVQSMKYLDCVVSETLRMFPPGPRLEREATDDYELGHSNFTVPKGMLISVPVYAIQHDPDHYPEPEKFDPERFTAEAKALRNPYTFLPFGAGPRNCIGMRFALVETKMCLAQFFSKFRVKPCSETDVPLQFHVSQGLLHPKKIALHVVLRTDYP